MRQDFGLRLNRNVTVKSLAGKSKKYQLDTVKKYTLYNLEDLSTILYKAHKLGIKEIELPLNLFVLIDDPVYGYDLESLKGKLLGIKAQLDLYKMKVTFPKGYKEIHKKIMQILA